MATAKKSAGKGAVKAAAGGKKVKAKAADAAPSLPLAAAHLKPASPVTPAKAEKADKDRPKKAKLVRDSFAIPKAEFAVLEDLKLRAAKLGRPTKKSEVLRAGVQALAAMGDAAFLATVGSVPAIKTGRPAKSV